MVESNPFSSALSVLLECLEPTISTGFLTLSITLLTVLPSILLTNEELLLLAITRLGDWGTGKTTLMNSIYAKLQNNKSILVRFETWRYEREEQFALIPLLKTIAFALPDEARFQSLKQKLKRGATNFLKKTPDIVSSIISKYSGPAGTITQAAIAYVHCKCIATFPNFPESTAKKLKTKP